MTIEEIFAKHARRIRGIEPATPDEIAELEKHAGRPLPKQLRDYLRLAGRNAGNLRFVQTHKNLEPTIADAIAHQRPRRHGRRAERHKDMIFFGDDGTCQDCGPAFLLLEPHVKLPKVEIDPNDPPVIGWDYDDPVLLAPTFTAYVQAAIP